MQIRANCSFLGEELFDILPLQHVGHKADGKAEQYTKTWKTSELRLVIGDPDYQMDTDENGGFGWLCCLIILEHTVGDRALKSRT